MGIGETKRLNKDTQDLFIEYWTKDEVHVSFSFFFCVFVCIETLQLCLTYIVMVVVEIFYTK